MTAIMMGTSPGPNSLLGCDGRRGRLMTVRSMAKPRHLVYGALYAILLIILYHSAYGRLIGYDWQREDYNYCFLIPFVVLYLAWEKKDAWIKEASIPSWGGLLLLLPAMLLYWIGELAGEFFSLYISSWLVVTGLLWTHVGWKKMKIMAFPLFVSLFLFPLPIFINTKLTLSLKLISSGIGIKIIQIFGMSGFREGNIIDLGFAQLQVVDACSGLRYLLPLVLMGLLMAYFYKAPLWKRGVLVLSTIPLSIVTNSLRIAVTAFLYPLMGRAAAEGFFHDFSGWAIFMVSLAVLLAEVWILRMILPGSEETFMPTKRPATAESKSPDQKETGGPATSGIEKPFNGLPQFIAVAAILGFTVLVHSFVDLSEAQPAGRSFSTFPLQVGLWEGKRQYLDQQFIDVLEFTDYTSVNYSKPGSAPVNVYVAYYASQRKGKSIHSPETCLPSSGWVFKQAGTIMVPLPGGRAPLPVARALMEKDDQKQLVYFWFDQRGRVLTSSWELKVYNLWDALTKKRTDGALVRVITPITGLEGAEEADRRLESFIQEISPSLREFIPGPTV